MAAEPTLFSANDDGTLTVAEVGRRIERALRREFGDAAVWVRGEIRDLKRAPSGHVHFSLSDGDRQLPVVLFQSDRERVNRMLLASGPAVRMEDGIEVRIRVELRWFAPKSQVSLRMVAIDPTFTLGRLAERRDQLLRRLAADGLLEAQRRLPFPAVPLRIGLVTSLGSAAHADVRQTLEASGLGFQLVECDSRVQGPEAEPALIAALLAVRAADVDVICLVRGGGARTDLAVFDGEALARAVATLDRPVLTGIGHEVDTSVVDEVAWQRHLTPTACGAFLVDRVRAYCARRDEVLGRCLRAAGVATTRSEDRIDRAVVRLGVGARRDLRDAGRRVDVVAAALRTRPLAALDRAAAAHAHRATRVRSVDPALLLARGWSITRTAEGRLVKGPADVAPGDELRTVTAGGEVASRVEAGS
jgi:exodeoxyribonuclease VII large subunit